MLLGLPWVWGSLSVGLHFPATVPGAQVPHVSGCFYFIGLRKDIPHRKPKSERLRSVGSRLNLAVGGDFSVWFPVRPVHELSPPLFGAERAQTRAVRPGMLPLQG